MTPMRTTALIGLSFAALFLAQGCASDGVSGKPPAPLTYSHLAPLYVQAGSIDVVTQYDPTRNPADVSNTLPTPPESALKSYAFNRLKPAGYEGTLRFIIEDATVTKTFVPPTSQMLDMMNAGAQDRYDATLHVRMFRVGVDGRESDNGLIRLRRFMTLPQSYSLARRDFELQKFVQSLMDDVDQSVTTTLQGQLNLIAPAPSSGGYGYPDSMGAPAPLSVPSVPVESETLTGDYAPGQPF